MNGIVDDLSWGDYTDKHSLYNKIIKRLKDSKYHKLVPTIESDENLKELLLEITSQTVELADAYNDREWGEDM